MQHHRGFRVPALFLFAMAAAFVLCPASHVYAQVINSSIAGVVKDAQGLRVPGATVTAVHQPSGTTYETVTRSDGTFSIIAMRVGGPYAVKADLAGFQPQTVDGVFLNLGVGTDLALTLSTVAVAEQVTVVGQSDPVFASNRTGAATTISRETLESLPSIYGTLSSVTRLTPQSGGGMSFVGQDSKMNNITVDGSYFNNSFGLGNGIVGGKTGVAAISLSAIEQIQVNVSPFDVRQGNFVGASVNTITRSGTNQFRGSLYQYYRNEDMVGTQAKDLTVNPGTFTFGVTGQWVGGPIVKNRLFFFESFENETTTQPATLWVANTGGQPVVGNTTRVLASDLDAMAAFLKSKFDYDPGIYQGYDRNVPAKRFMGKADYNLGNRNKLTFRYTHLDSSVDSMMSGSSSLGNGNRNGNANSMSFSASNYVNMENIRSVVGLWNSVLGNSKANELIVGYSHHDESRAPIDKIFPVVDVLGGDNTGYMSFGAEPFSLNNELRYRTFQIQDNFTSFFTKHTLTFGATFEDYHSENIFFPGQQSVYVYNTLAEFYADANGYLANPGRTTSPVTLNRFQVRYMNLPGLDRPIQPLDAIEAGAYAQDEWSAAGNLKVTAGVRFDVVVFGDTGYANANADALTFRDQNGQAVQYSTKKLPDPKVLWSPRVGFNWDVTRDQKTQIRGGTGVFTGKPAFVWISNQIGNTGVLTGFEDVRNTTARPFNPNPATYKPAGPLTGAPAATYELALTDPDFRFPQTWRSNIALDRRLFWGLTSTTEFIYNGDVNGFAYINANLPAPQSAFTGADTRVRWVAPTGIIATRLPANQHVANAVVLQNQSVGRSWNFAQTISKRLWNGLSFQGSYSYGEARNIIDPGSIAYGSWSGNYHSGDPNNPALAFAGDSPGNRVLVTATYTKQFFSFGTTTVSGIWEARNGSHSSYAFSGDANGDGGASNDLIYIPRNTAEMNFASFASGGVTYGAADQAAAWEAYINQDAYLSTHRGQYAQRGAVFYPWLRRMDLSLTQEFFHTFSGQRHGFELRLDILNLGNLLNQDWGVGSRMATTSPLTNPGVDANGAMNYRLRVISGKLVDHTFEQSSGLSDVYSFMVTVRYRFN